MFYLNNELAKLACRIKDNLLELFLDEVDPIVLIWLNERVFFPSSTKITHESDISIYNWIWRIVVILNFKIDFNFLN